MKPKTHKQAMISLLLFMLLTISLTTVLLPFFRKLSDPAYPAGFLYGTAGGTMIGLCRRKRLGRPDRITTCESLDLAAAASCVNTIPGIYCHLQTEGHIEIERLKQAVSKSAGYVPEILYVFNEKHSCFTDCGLTAEHAVHIREKISHADPLEDLSVNPQLQIIISSKEQQDLITIGISHILTDGAGFIQYLYLLAALYNGKNPGNMVNCRDIRVILRPLHIQPATEQTRHHRRIAAALLLDDNHLRKQAGSAGPVRYFNLTASIGSGDFRILCAKAKNYNVTLNDVFLTAYARTISHLQNHDTVILPCPADLRRFGATMGQLTVANMTGMYKRISVEVSSPHTFDQTLAQVHLEMALQKSRYRCLSGIRPLTAVFYRIPHGLLKRIIKAVYPLSPVSYTNLGVIDEKQLYFDNCMIRNCYVTGTYRSAPEFQLSVTTFRGTCCLSCALSGDLLDKEKSRIILSHVKDELLVWAHTHRHDDIQLPPHS